MGVLSSMFNVTASVYRFTTATPTSSDAVTTVSTAILGLVRPVTDKAQLFVESNYGKEFDFVCDDGAGIKVRDDLVIGSTTYTVQGVSDYTDLEGDFESHLDIRLFRK